MLVIPLRRMVYCLCFFSTLVSFVSCNDQASSLTEEETVDPETKNAADYVKAGNEFALDLLARVNETRKESFVISPISLEIVLGMLHTGAANATDQQICKLLGFDENGSVNEYYQSLIETLAKLDPSVTVSMANAIIANKNMSLRPSFIQDAQTFYQANAWEMDFGNPGLLADTVNGWVADKTGNMIPRILDPQDNYNGMQAFLINALYFKGNWATSFDETRTDKATFYHEDGTETLVDMMHLTERFYTNLDEDAHSYGLSLPYGNGAYQLTVLLPVSNRTPDSGQKPQTVSGLLSSLDADFWERHWTEGGESMTAVDLPRFEIETDINLNAPLKEMGMTDAFGSFADFSGMSPAKPTLAGILQKSKISVNEKGSKASSVTASTSYNTSPGDGMIFRCNKPFLFFISETETGAILFAGKYNGADR